MQIGNQIRVRSRGLVLTQRQQKTWKRAIQLSGWIERVLPVVYTTRRTFFGHVLSRFLLWEKLKLKFAIELEPNRIEATQSTDRVQLSSVLECSIDDAGYSAYSAAQISPNQNIRVIRVSPIRVYAYAYTQIGGFMLTSVFAHLHTTLCTEENLLGVYWLEATKELVKLKTWLKF